MTKSVPPTSPRAYQPSFVPTLKKPAMYLTQGDQRKLLALGASGIGTWLWNVCTNSIVWDAPCKALFGFAEKESDITFERVLSRIHDDDVDKTSAAVEHLLETRREYDVVHLVIWPDRSIHWIQLKGAFLTGPHSMEVAGIALDVVWAMEHEQEHVEIQRLMRVQNQELDQRFKERTALLERTANESMRLASRIMQVQDEERRKLARELHDGMGQYLSAIKIHLDTLLGQTSPKNRVTRAALSSCVEMTELCLSEARTLSHLMHPPLLDEVGLLSAVRWYVEGFVKRSGIEVKMQLPENLPRLQRNMELALFRVLQESLTNVHLHSECSLAEINIEANQRDVVLKVKDNGKGMPAERVRQLHEVSAGVGVGLAGMRERVRDLGGYLDVASSKRGTIITAVAPIAPRETETHTECAA